ncbi:MAG: hypothetical protein WCW31_06265 [Patescibacteria group bacterium]|jgi:hypothetical protein
MSWKRILKAARKLGMPVIIADESGKDPFVAMTLSKFEDMVEENDLLTGLDLGEDDFEDDLEDDLGGLDPRLEQVFEEQALEEPVNFAEQTEKMSEVPFMEPMSEEQESPKTKGEMPLEDRFYFEPLEDEFKK